MTVNPKLKRPTTHELALFFERLKPADRAGWARPEALAELGAEVTQSQIALALRWVTYRLRQRAALAKAQREANNAHERSLGGGGGQTREQSEAERLVNLERQANISIVHNS